MAQLTSPSGPLDFVHCVATPVTCDGFQQPYASSGVGLQVDLPGSSLKAQARMLRSGRSFLGTVLDPSVAFVSLFAQCNK